MIYIWGKEVIHVDEPVKLRGLPLPTWRRDERRIFPTSTSFREKMAPSFQKPI